MIPRDLPDHLDALDRRQAIAGVGGVSTFAELATLCSQRMPLPIPVGSVVALAGDITSDALAWEIALLAQGCIVAPIGPTWSYRIDAILDLIQAEYLIADGVLQACGVRSDPASELYQTLRERGHAGLVLLTSGSTGTPKVVVHDADAMLRKISRPGRRHRTLAFLSFDHIGGQNTILYSLVHGGCLVVPSDRSPDSVCAAIQDYRAELLPTSPSFLRTMLVSGAAERYDLNSLSLISYGSEPMPESTLAALNEALPGVVKLQQYGMSELGVLRSRSRSDDSTWIKLGGPEFGVRVVDGRLEVRAETAMLGYLNAPSPFTEDGWLRTGDLAEMDGEWIRILGRDSDVINVGGEKVHPAEVESVIEEMEGVLQAVVHRAENPILGQVVAARVTISTHEPPDQFRQRLRRHCARRLARHMVPQKIEIAEQVAAGLKKQRIA